MSIFVDFFLFFLNMHNNHGNTISEKVRKELKKMLRQDLVDHSKLEALRKYHGYSIQDMATFLGYRTPTGYWQLERGARQITASQMYLIADRLQVEMKDLFITK